MSKTYTVVGVYPDGETFVDHIRAMTPMHAGYIAERNRDHAIDTLAVFIGKQYDEFNQAVFDDIAVERMKLLDAEMAAEDNEINPFSSFAWPQNKNCLGCSHAYWRRGENHCQDSCCEMGITDPNNCTEPVRYPVDE